MEASDLQEPLELLKAELGALRLLIIDPSKHDGRWGQLVRGQGTRGFSYPLPENIKLKNPQKYVFPRCINSRSH